MESICTKQCFQHDSEGKRFVELFGLELSWWFMVMTVWNIRENGWKQSGGLIVTPIITVYPSLVSREVEYAEYDNRMR